MGLEECKNSNFLQDKVMTLKSLIFIYTKGIKFLINFDLLL